MQIFPVPSNLKELTHNIRSVITDKRSLLLGKDCEVLLGETCISGAPLEKISSLFESIVTSQEEPKELIEFKSALTVYDRMLTLCDLQVPNINSYHFFGPLIERVWQIYQSMPLLKRLPATSSLLTQYEARAQKSAKEVQPFLQNSQNILTLLQFEKMHYDFFSKWSYYMMNTSLGNKTLLFIGLHGSNAYSLDPDTCEISKSEMNKIKQSNCIELSEIDLGFSLSFYDDCHDDKKCDFDVSNLGEKKYIELINKIKELLSNNTSIDEKNKKTLILCYKSLLRKYIGILEDKYVNKGLNKFVRLISQETRNQFFEVMPHDPFTKELSFSSLNTTTFTYHNDPSTPEIFDPNFILSLHDSVTAIEFSMTHLQELYRVVHLELFKPLTGLQASDKRLFYSLQKSIYDNQKFEDPSEFCKPTLPDKVPEVKQNAGSSSDWLPPLPKPKKTQNRKKSPPPTTASVLTNQQPIHASSSETVPQAIQKSAALRVTTPSISYDVRVHDWRINPKKMLSSPAFNGQSDHSKELSRIFHAFALEVDKYVFSHGIQSKWHNQKRTKEDTHFSIPGEITIHGEVKRGIFTYCFDKDSICYHRCFTEKTSGDAMREYIEKGFWEVDFPSLEASGEKEKTVHSEQIADDRSFLSKQINSYTIEIEDPRNHATIRLFKIKSS